MKIDIAQLDAETAFQIRLQIALINNARKVLDPSRKERFEQYINERIKKIKELLHAEYVVILDGDRILFEG